MTDELYVSMSSHDENTSTTIGRLPDDEDYELDIFIPRECRFGLPERMPKMKRIRFMFGGCDSEFYDEYRKYGEVILFSTFWLFEYSKTVNILSVKNIDYEFEKMGIVMNNYPKRHRQIFFKHLENQEILSESYWSWITPISREPDSNWFNDEEIFSKETEKKTLPSQPNISSEKSTEFELYTPIEYKKTFLDIVSETSIDVPFITEKTYRPLLFGKPFIVNACKGFYSSLQSLGFKLYDELFDYSFDLIDDNEERILAVSKEISKIKDEDYDYLWNLIYDKIKFNQQRCFEIIENEIGVPQIDSFQSDSWDFIIKGAKEKLPYLKENISI